MSRNMRIPITLFNQCEDKLQNTVKFQSNTEGRFVDMEFENHVEHLKAMEILYGTKQANRAGSSINS